MRKKNKLLSALLAVLFLLSAMSISAFAADGSGGSTTLTTTIPCTVTLQVGDHGKVTVNSTDYTGDASFTAAVGTALTYTFTPNTLYKVDKVIYNGTDVTGELSGNTYTAPALAGNASLSVSFSFLGGGGTDTYTVTFNANGHGTAPASQTVLSGNKAAEPTAPTASGWTFGGWYKDSACTDTLKYDFDTPVTADLDLYAKWTEKPTEPTDPTDPTGPTDPIDPEPKTYTVSFFMSGHGTQIAAQTVKDGSKAEKPADPTESNWAFKGWYTDAKFQTAFDFDTAITADITLYAKWVSTAPIDPNLPQTGDNSMIFMWLLLLSGSGMVLAGIAMNGRKKKQN